MKSSRVVHLEKTLAIKGYTEALKALDLMMEEMSAKNNFVRKGDGLDYYYHLVDVTQYILNTIPEIDEVTIISSLLHDYIEDVEDVNYKVVELQFGKEVATIVSKLSKKDGIDYKNNHEEMQNYLDIISEDYKASIIKTADRVHNFSTLSNLSENHRIKQLDNTLDYFLPFFKNCRNKYPRYSGYFIISQNIISPIANEIKLNIENAQRKEKEIKILKEQLANKN